MLFTDPADHLEIDLSGMLRGDAEARWQSYGIAIQNGILTPNEIREGEGYDARPDGDVLRTMPGAPSPGAPGMPDGGMQPGARPNGSGMAPAAGTA